MPYNFGWAEIEEWDFCIETLYFTWYFLYYYIGWVLLKNMLLNLQAVVDEWASSLFRVYAKFFMHSYMLQHRLELDSTTMSRTVFMNFFFVPNNDESNIVVSMPLMSFSPFDFKTLDFLPFYYVPLWVFYNVNVACYCYLSLASSEWNLTQPICNLSLATT